MTHLTPTTRDHKSSNGKVTTFTEWTTGCYTLRHTYEDEYNYHRWAIISADRNLPSIYVNEPMMKGDPTTTSVNWSAMGSRPADEARLYGTHLIMAAQAAETFQQVIAEFGQNA